MADSAFRYVDVYEGSDGLAYYTTVYRNGEKGPRSEGYEGGLNAAIDAANRDFPGVTIRVTQTGEPKE